MLADAVERDPSRISDLLNKGKTSRGTLNKLTRVLDVDFPHLLPQLEFELEINAQFIADAQNALQVELERLHKEVGTVSAKLVTGSVGLQFHGQTPHRHAIERRFPIKLTRKASSAKKSG